MTVNGSSEEERGASRATMARRLLSRLARPLAFDEPLESQFRHWHTEHTRSRIRNAMWIAIGSMLLVMFAGGPFRAMRDAIFARSDYLTVDVLRFGVIVPISIALLLVTYTSLYRRWFGITAQVVAPIYAMAFVAMDMMTIVNEYIEKVLQSVPKNNNGTDLSKIMPTIVRWSILGSLIFTFLIALAKIGLYVFGLIYLRKPHIQALFQQKKSPQLAFPPA